MDSLHKYKEAWQNQQIENQLNTDSLLKMIHKSSSSIVKWIFYVSLIEFAIVVLLNILIKIDWDYYRSLGLFHFMKGVSIFGYIIFAVFIYLFYKNYKSISVHQTTKELMANILNTRKTVKYYVIINLISVAFALFYSFYVILQSEDYETLMDKIGDNGHLIVWGIVIFAILFVVGLTYAFYALLYGILIHRLNDNYKELVEEVF